MFDLAIVTVQGIIVQALLDHTKDDKHPNSTERNRALLTAVESEQHEIVQVFLNHAINSECLHYDVIAPLRTAAREEYVIIVQQLLRYTVIKGDLSSVFIVLLKTAEAGDVKAMRLLLKQGAYNSQTDHYRLLIFFGAVQKGHCDVVQLLIDNGADINQVNGNGNSALILGAICGHVKAVQLLLDHGADINHANSTELVPIFAAAMHGHAETATLLI